MMPFFNAEIDETSEERYDVADLAKLEEEIGIKLNFLFRKFMQKFSGRVLSGTEQVTIAVSNDHYVTIKAFLELEKIHPLMKIMESKFSEENKFIPFAVTTLGEYLCLDASFSNEHQVIVVNTATRKIVKINSSFEQFMRYQLNDDNCNQTLSEGKMIQKKIVPFKDINTNSSNLLKIEEIVGNMQKNEINRATMFLENVRRQLNREFNADCVEIRICNNTGKGFFGAAIYPTIDEVDKMAQGVITAVSEDGKVTFKNCTKFIIELDSKLVYDMGATPREIVAVILHELGHVVYNKQALISTCTRIATTLIGEVASIGALALKVLSPLKFLLYQAIIIGFSSVFEFRNGLKDEEMADSLAVRYGYGADLFSVLQKMTDLGMSKKSVNDKKKEQDLVCKWSVGNLINFKMRKAKIERELKNLLKSKDISDYERQILQNQLNQIAKYKGGSERLMESYTGGFNKEAVLLESLNTFLKDVSSNRVQKELDLLSIEIDRIEDSEDKMYCTLRIHKMRKTALKYMDELTALYDKGKMTESEYDKKRKMIETYLDEIEVVRLEILKVKIKEKKYGVFAKIGIDEYDAL